MGMASDALQDLTGVTPNPVSAPPPKYDLQPGDTGMAADALRDLTGQSKPTTFADRFSAVQDRPLETYNPKQPDQKPGFAGRILIGFNNQQLAASQRTDSNPADYKLVSGKTYQNDAGEILYDDPVTGQLTPTDRNKHVILTDPADGKLKVYERSDKTDEGILAAAGHMLETGMATGAPVSRAYQAVSAARPAEEVIAAGNRLSQTGGRVDVPRIISSDSLPVQEVGSAVANVPLAGSPLVKASINTINQLGSKAEEIAGGYGSRATVDQSGDVARQSIKDWVTGTSKQTAEKLYNKVDALIDPNAKGGLDSTMSTMQKIEADRKAAGLPPSGAVQQVMEAATRPEGLTYGGIKTLRTTIGEQLKPGMLPPGTSQGELERIYGSLTQDLGKSVEMSGNQPAMDAFNRANNYYRLASERRQNLATIVGENADAAPERVFDRLKAMAGSNSRADIGKLAQARKVMGADDWNEVSSTIVSRMGRDADGNFTPRRFLTDYNKISPAGKNLLFKSGGQSGLAQSLDDIATISSRFKQLEKFSNPSGSSRSVVGALIGSAGWAEPLSTAVTVLGGNLLARVLASPAGASSVAKWARANLLLAQTPTPARLAAFSNASRNLISTAGAQNVSVNDFLRALQSPATSRADEQKVPGKPSQ